METREDNTKKNNEELELLSDDELDKVAGGAGGWIGFHSFPDDDSQPSFNPGGNPGGREGGK